jgi:uracil-DNA glycosylase
MKTSVVLAEPGRDCPLCPRLLAYRLENRAENPGWWNGPAPSFGDPDARLLIVGLAPGRTGANRTGRPFTGDYAGDLLYGTLLALGLARGDYRADPQDGLALSGVMITNAVRCAPPQNKPTPEEISQCRPHLNARIAALPKLRAFLALGAIAHDSILRAFAVKPSAARFAHGAQTSLPEGRTLVSSYHCSRYNTQTRRLTPEMFKAALMKAWAAAET